MATLADIDQFKQDVRGREVNRDSTLEDYCRWIERFEHWFDGQQPDETTLRRFDSYLFESSEFPWDFTRPLRDESYAYATRIKALSALKLWLRVHYGEEVTNEVQNICLGEPDDFDPDVLSEHDVAMVKQNAADHCPCDDCSPAIRLGYDAIMRCAEIADARVEDFDPDTGSIYVRAKKGSLSKTIGLDSDTTRALDDHVSRIGDREYLFHNTYGRPWKSTALSTHFWRKHHEVGIHSFTRHSPIVHRLSAGEPLGDVFQRARHTNISTTMRYARLVDVDVPDWAREQAG